MARKKKPIEQHIKDGTYRKERHESLFNPNANLIKEVPDVPEYFNDYALKEWKRILPELIRLKMLSNMDLGILEIAIQNYGVYRECQEIIYTEHYLDKAGKKRKRKRSLAQFFIANPTSRNPVLTLMENSFKKYNDIIKRFGITPLDRSKIVIEIEKSAEELNPILNLIK